MAISPGSKQRDTRTTVPSDQPLDPASLNPMQEPLGSMDRPIHRSSDDNDVNLSSRGTGRTAGNLGTTGTAEQRRSGFTTIIAIVAVVLLAAFLVTLYLNTDRNNVATTPAETQAPVAGSGPDTTGDTTGSTTPPIPPAPAQDTAPATGSTGSGTTAPATP